MRPVSGVILTLLEMSLTRGLASQTRETREKRSSVQNHFVDDHCEGHFQVETNTIIRTEDSINMGGSFLNETQVLSLSRCLHYCCTYPLCNTAVFDERMDSSEGGSCYLFDCGSLDDLKCQFTANPDFSAAVLDIDRHKFDILAEDHHQGHSSQLEGLRGGAMPERGGGGPGPGGRECGQFEWRCGSGECVASYDTCNGIPQCVDASDEDPAQCPVTSTLQPPVHVHRRPDMDPPGPPQQPGGYPQQQQMGAGSGYWPQQQQQQQQLQGRPDYFYPGQNQMNTMTNVMAGGRGRGPSSLGADYVYQYPGIQQQGYQYQGQYPQQQLLPYQQGYPQPPPQLPVQPPVGQATAKPASKVTSTTKRTTTRRPPATTTTTTLSPEEKFESELIAELGDELTDMRMPGFAMFTLSLGVIMTSLLCVLVCCRIKQGKMGFRRGLAHDADGDFLVNGMYL